MNNTQDYTGMTISHYVAADSLGELEDRAGEFAEYAQGFLSKEFPGADIEFGTVEFRTRSNATEVTLPSGASSHGGITHEFEEIQEAEKFSEWVEQDVEKAYVAWLDALNA